MPLNFPYIVLDEKVPILPVRYIFGDIVFDRHGNHSTTEVFRSGWFDNTRLTICIIGFFINAYFFLKNIFHESLKKGIHVAHVVVYCLVFLNAMFSLIPMLDTFRSVKIKVTQDVLDQALFQEMHDLIGILQYCATGSFSERFKKKCVFITKDYRNLFDGLLPDVLFVIFFCNPFINFRVLRFKVFAVISLIVLVLPALFSFLNWLSFTKTMIKMHFCSITKIIRYRYFLCRLVFTILDLISRFFFMIRFVEDNIFIIEFEKIGHNSSKIRTVLDYGLQFAVLNTLLSLIYVPLAFNFNNKPPKIKVAPTLATMLIIQMIQLQKHPIV